VAAHPDDTAARSVLADAWQQAGDPRGELIALQLHRKARRVSARERELLRAHPLAPFTERGWTFEWHAGFASAATFVRGDLTGDDERESIAELLASEHVMLVRRLELTLSEEAIADAARGVASTSRALSSLGIHDADFNGVERAPDEDPYNLIPDDVCASLVAALPGLRELALTGHGIFGSLAHPALEQLRTRGALTISPDGYDSGAVELPNLQTFEQTLVFECDFSMEALDLAFDLADTPKLREVRLHGGPYLEDMLPWLAERSIATAVEVLDVARVIDDGGVAGAIEAAPRFPKLRALSIDWLRGTVAHARALRRAYPKLRILHRTEP
jgi:uncharacterized protein (TIGR02996 family)